MSALPVERRCTAKAKSTGGQCGRLRMAGQQVCNVHGGRAPQNRAAASRRLAEAKALRSLAEKGVTPMGDPLEAFRSLAAEALALKEWAAAHVAELQDQLTKTDKTGREDVAALVALYERAMDRAGRLLGEYVRLGIEDRLAALDERRAALAERIIVKVLAHAGVPLTDDVRAVMVRELSPQVIEARRE